MKSSLIILLCFLYAGSSAQSGNANLCRWHTGDNPEMSYYQSVKNTGLLYCLTNDNDNIYIDLKFADRVSQGAILQEGLILWIDMEGRSLKKMGVRFPAGSQNQGSYDKTRQPEIAKSEEADGSSLLKMANTIELIGFISEQERRFPSENPDNFRGSVSYDEDKTLHYKMTMPVSKLPVRNSKENKGAMPFNLGIEYGFPPVVNEPGGKMTKGRNAKDLQTKAGSEIHWIKNVKLASSR
jgi:hypothetical protein